MTGQLDAILSYVAKLDELDTTGVAVTTHTQPVVNAFREDEVRPFLPRERALAKWPGRRDDEAFVVPASSADSYRFFYLPLTRH